jgi:hypothetical protein
MTEGMKYPVGTCFHEAGHAVVAAALDLKVKELRVSADDESGGTDIRGLDISFIDQVAVCFAGLEAQNIWNCPSEHLAGGDDYRRFFKLVEGLSDDCREALRKAGRERARDLLQINKQIVEDIAQHLMERGRITAAEFKQFRGG